MSAMFSSLIFAGGFALGLASSLHCFRIFGGIATATLLPSEPGKGLKSKMANTVNIQTGQVLSYALAGLLVGALGAGALGHQDHPVMYNVLRSAASVSLAWMGLSMIGIAPPIRPLDRLFLTVSKGIDELRRRLPVSEFSTAVLSGFAWGILPCAMVYGALFFVVPTGSAKVGAWLLAGYGLGTMPVLAACTGGARSLRLMLLRPGVQIATAVTLAAISATIVLISLENFAFISGG